MNTAADVKWLREQTGASMRDIKAALTASDGDVQVALKALRRKGIAVSICRKLPDGSIQHEKGYPRVSARRCGARPRQGQR